MAVVLQVKASQRLSRLAARCGCANNKRFVVIFPPRQARIRTRLNAVALAGEAPFSVDSPSSGLPLTVLKNGSQVDRRCLKPQQPSS